MHTFCHSERGRIDTAMTRDCSAAVRSGTLKSTLKSIEKHFASSEGITMEQRGRRTFQGRRKGNGYNQQLVMVCSALFV